MECVRWVELHHALPARRDKERDVCRFIPECEDPLWNLAISDADAIEVVPFDES